MIARLQFGLRGDLDRIHNYLAAGDRGAEVRALARGARDSVEALRIAVDRLTDSEDDRALRRASSRLIAELVIIERELAGPAGAL